MVGLNTRESIRSVKIDKKLVLGNKSARNNSYHEAQEH